MGGLGGYNVEEWQDGEWDFRAVEYAPSKWHVWCSKSKLVATNPLLEPFNTKVFFEFSDDKKSGLAGLLKQIKINDPNR